MGKGKYEPTDLERARDELFSHIQRCGVLEASEEQREEWMEDTVGYLSERYPGLSRQELEELRKLGDRYCRPAIPHGNADASEAWSGGESEGDSGTEEDAEPRAVAEEAADAPSAPEAGITAG